MKNTIIGAIVAAIIGIAAWQAYYWMTYKKAAADLEKASNEAAAQMTKSAAEATSRMMNNF